MVSLLRSHQVSFKYTMQFETCFSSFFPPVLGMTNARVPVYIFFLFSFFYVSIQAQAQTLLGMDKWKMNCANPINLLQTAKQPY